MEIPLSKLDITNPLENHSEHRLYEAQSAARRNATWRGTASAQAVIM